MYLVNCELSFATVVLCWFTCFVVDCGRKQVYTLPCRLRMSWKTLLLFFIQAGKLERRRWIPASTPDQRDKYTAKVRCTTYIPVAQLKTAFKQFGRKVPKMLAAADLSRDNPDSAPHQAAQTDRFDAPEHRQTPAASHDQPALHTSASTGAAIGMAPPAYATQMDGPDDVFDALAAAAAPSLNEQSTAIASHHAVEGLHESGDKRDRAASQDLSDGVPSKKAKSGQL